MRRLAACALLLALTSPSQAASLTLARAAAAGEDVDQALHRHVRAAAPNAAPDAGPGGKNTPIDAAAAGPVLAPVGAVLDQQSVSGKKGDSSEELNAQIAFIEKKIAELLKPVPLAERAAAKKEEMAAKQAPQQQEAPQQQAAPDPDPAQPGPDKSNKEDGDGNGNQHQQGGQNEDTKS